MSRECFTKSRQVVGAAVLDLKQKRVHFFLRFGGFCLLNLGAEREHESSPCSFSHEIVRIECEPQTADITVPNFFVYDATA